MIREVTKITRLGRGFDRDTGAPKRTKLFLRLSCGHVIERRERRIGETPKRCRCEECAS